MDGGRLLEILIAWTAASVVLGPALGAVLRGVDAAPGTGQRAYKPLVAGLAIAAAALVAVTSLGEDGRPGDRRAEGPVAAPTRPGRGAPAGRAEGGFRASRLLGGLVTGAPDAVPPQSGATSGVVPPDERSTVAGAVQAAPRLVGLVPGSVGAAPAAAAPALLPAAPMPAPVAPSPLLLPVPAPAYTAAGSDHPGRALGLAKTGSPARTLVIAASRLVAASEPAASPGVEAQDGPPGKRTGR